MHKNEGVSEYFYPRPPRGERQCTIGGTSGLANDFYPRPPRGERRRRTAEAGRKKISIHALREESDQAAGMQALQNNKFLSTPSARRATSDAEMKRTLAVQFLSTPSARRATAASACFSVIVTEFLSTPSARRATAPALFHLPPLPISIHALREESDGAVRKQKGHRRNFYPRPPRGERQQKQRQNLYFQTNYTTFCTNLEEL